MSADSPDPKQRVPEPPSVTEADSTHRADYEPPRLTSLGSIEELTRGNNTQAVTDGAFPGSMF